MVAYTQKAFCQHGSKIPRPVFRVFGIPKKTNTMNRAYLLLERLHHKIREQKRKLEIQQNQIIEDVRRKILMETIEPRAGPTSFLKDIYGRY